MYKVIVLRGTIIQKAIDKGLKIKHSQSLLEDEILQVTDLELAKDSLKALIHMILTTKVAYHTDNHWTYSDPSLFISLK